MKYLLDSDSFITPARTYYRLDGCPKFWQWLVHCNRKGVIFSIYKVKQEIVRQKDELARWAKTQGDEFFQKPTAETYEACQQVADWVESYDKYIPATRQAFFDCADYFLVAHAVAHTGFTVVTFETHQPMSKRVKIPTVCKEFQVNCIDLHTLTRREGLQL